MLFDPKPKDRREDLFGRDREVEALEKALNSPTPLIVLLGVRRIGKTSLLKTVLNELNYPYIYLDLRVLEDMGYSKAVFYRLLSEEFSRLALRWRVLRSLLRGVRGVGIAGFHVEFDWSREGISLSSIFNLLDEWVNKSFRDGFIVIALDEAQLLRNMIGGKGRIDFRSLIAYCYDNLKHVKFVLTGSEVGLLMDFIGIENSRSPLYGRVREEIVLERFSEDQAIGFLEAGFNEYGMRINYDLLRGVVESLDGIVGWLTYYGYKAVRKGRIDNELTEQVIGEASRMVRDELEPILKRSKYYALTLKSIAIGRRKWIDIKRTVEAWLNRPVTNTQIVRILETLVKLSIIRKNGSIYEIIDPIIRRMFQSQH